MDDDATSDIDDGTNVNGNSGRDFVDHNTYEGLLSI